MREVKEKRVSEEKKPSTKTRRGRSSSEASISYGENCMEREGGKKKEG